MTENAKKRDAAQAAVKPKPRKAATARAGDGADGEKAPRKRADKRSPVKKGAAGGAPKAPSRSGKPDRADKPAGAVRSAEAAKSVKPAGVKSAEAAKSGKSAGVKSAEAVKSGKPAGVKSAEAVKSGKSAGVKSARAAGAAERGGTAGKNGAARKTGPARVRSASEKSGAKPKGASGKSGAKLKSASGKPGAKRAGSRSRGARDDLFLERDAGTKPAAAGGEPPRRHTALFGALNACLAIAIAVLVALGLRVHGRYGEFLAMRRVVDRQTFYEGTTVEGVDVSRMTLSNAMDYWRDRVEARNAARTVTLDDGTVVTAGELGYASDYESVLTTAWSMGRSGTLEERYRMASARVDEPVAYAIHRTAYDEALVDQFVALQALKINQPAEDASVAGFNVETYEFTFNPSRTGARLDAEALKRDLEQALASGGGSVSLSVAELPPEITTDRIGQMYGLIDYAITNASSSSRARLSNIKLAMSLINGAKLAPGETFSFNDTVGQRTVGRGFRMATAYSGGEVTEQVGGGICQVSTTLFNAAVKADMRIDERYNHSLTVAYVDKGKDATVDWGHQDLKFTNTSADDIYICCYLTEDKRVRFGIFGRLLPDGERITLDAVTTEVVKFQREYQPDPTLGSGQVRISQNGRDGYKAEAYKVRWDAEGNQLSRELLCKSVYKVKNEIVLYGA